MGRWSHSGRDTCPRFAFRSAVVDIAAFRGKREDGVAHADAEPAPLPIGLIPRSLLILEPFCAPIGVGHDED